MSTTLLACEEELSKQLGDYWASTTTSGGADGGTTLVDTALKAKENVWITDESYDMLTEESTGTAAIYEERKISSLSNTNGTLTVLTHAGTIESGIDYRIHRLFTASDKRRALVSAAKHIYPACFAEIWDESLVSGNWLKDGSFERWTADTDLTDWTDTDVVTTKTSTVGQFKHGSYGVVLSTPAGTLAQSISNFADLQFLRGKSVTFTLQAYCNTATALRISINDGTTQTHSSYHAGDSAWTEDNPRNDSFYVTQYITPNATEVTFTIHYENATATVYVDDARAISDYRGRFYIGNLGLAKNKPHQVFIEPTYYSQEEGWLRVRDYKVDKDGYLYIPTTYPSDYRLRITGIGYLDFYDADGAVGTDWTDTIDIDSPQLEILVAQAALYLYTWMAVPNYESGTREDYQQMIGYWKQELAERIAKFKMDSPSATIHWGVH